MHQNYIGLDVDKNSCILSVCLTAEDNYEVLQYRTILWQKMVRISIIEHNSDISLDRKSIPISKNFGSSTL